MHFSSDSDGVTGSDGPFLGELLKLGEMPLLAAETLLELNMLRVNIIKIKKITSYVFEMDRV